MKQKLLFMIAIIVAALCAAFFYSSRNANQRHPQVKQAESSGESHTHGAGEDGLRIPAYFQSAAEAKPLAPTLPPEQFFGQARLAYEAAKEIPETLAQLPCFCHCDRSFGHKSLHTCYESDHSAHCSICVSDALLAYKLQKEEGLTPAQIRERIIAKYSNHE